MIDDCFWLPVKFSFGVNLHVIHLSEIPVFFIDHNQGFVQRNLLGYIRSRLIQSGR